MVKENLMISDEDLGFALFFTSIGAVASMLVANRWIIRVGEGKVGLLMTLVFSVFIIFPLMAYNYWTLCAALFLVGASIGLLDIAMNAVATIFEKEDKVKIMAMCHGFFSLGGIIGAALGGILIAWKVDAIIQMTGGLFVVIPVQIGRASCRERV